MPPKYSKKKTVVKKPTNSRFMRRKPKTNQQALVRLIKSVTTKQMETKSRDVSLGKVELYHNVYTNLGNPFYLAYPTEGTGDDQRIGDSIMQRGIKFRMVLGQKLDRPNVTFKIWLLQVPKGQSFTSGQLFDNVCGNTMLDSTNPDRVKVIFHKTLKKVGGAYTFTGDSAWVKREMTFTQSFYVRRPKKITFTADNNIDPGYSDYDYFLTISCWDSYGSLLTDNIGYVQTFCRYYYKDP